MVNLTDQSVAIDIDENKPPENEYKPPENENKPSENENKPLEKPQDIKMSPNGEYLVAYSEKSKKFFGWSVGDIKEGKVISIDVTYEIPESEKVRIFHMCVSDEKILAYINKNESTIGKYNYRSAIY